MGKNKNQKTIIGQGEFGFENNTSFEIMSSNNQVEFLKEKNYSIKINPTALKKIVVKIEVTLPSDTVFAYVSTLAVKKTIKNAIGMVEVKRMNVSFTRLPNDPIDSKHTFRFSEFPCDCITEEILIFSNSIKGLTKVRAMIFSK